MANLRRSREGLSAAGQGSSVGVQEDDQLHTPSFRSQSDAYGDLCPPNDPNGHDARRRSGGLEDQQSPTSVAAPDVYGAEKRLPRRDDDDALHEQCVDDLLAQFRANASRKK